MFRMVCLAKNVRVKSTKSGITRLFASAQKQVNPKLFLVFKPFRIVTLAFQGVYDQFSYAFVIFKKIDHNFHLAVILSYTGPLLNSFRSGFNLYLTFG